MNLLIVDDEKEILEGILDGVSWEQLPFQEVFTACSASEAREVMEKHRVDLLLSDIEMDDESGLDLIRSVNERYPDCECLILSCHEDFGFAQRAVSLHCLGYILKPVPYTQLTKELGNAAETAAARHKQSLLTGYGKVYMQQLKEETTKGSREYQEADPLQQACEYIREHLSEDIPIEQLAQEVHVSPRQLGRLFQKEFGIPASEYIQNQRMELAAELLRDGKLSATMISDRVGYSNYSYFIRLFRKAFGMSPREYQQKNRTKNNG